MLKFAEIAQSYPVLRSAEERKRDFREIYENYAAQKAQEQAERCSQCGIPFCQVHCPLQNNIPDWLRLSAEGRLQEAYEVSSATNSFPEICGRICPQDRLCEGNCVVEKGFDSITIGAVEKFITETAWEEGWVKPFTPARELPQSVGIIGAGPAGMAAAEQLRRLGYQVTIYDRYDRAGGLLVYGIPNFKLDKQVVQRRTQQFEASGVQFVYGADVGGSTSFESIREQHDAVLIATGVYKARALDIPGADLENIVPAMTFLTASNRKGLGDAVPAFDSGSLDAKGKKVVVIGGGDTAMDCVRTSIRQGADSVTCLYRRDRENMPGSRREVAYAEEEGVQFDWLSTPIAFHGAEQVEQVRVGHMRLGAPDANGRRAPELIPGADRMIDADLVIQALGFEPEDMPALFNAPELKLSRYGTIVANNEGATNLAGVFAAGDIVRGASLVVWAIRDGREAAAGMRRYLETQAAVQKEAA